MAVQDPKAPNLVPINGSTNVYVGQRYVPKFYDDGTEQHGATWDKTQTYEPLTIVLWEGDSYTSRTFVPAGVEISDTQYWLATGLFNAQLESYIKKTTDNEKQIKELNLNTAKQIILLGDSYGGNYGGTTSNWRTVLTTLLENNGYTVFSAYINGASWNGEVISYLEVFNSVTGYDPNKNTIILLAAGANDTSPNIDAAKTAINNFYTAVKEKIPNSKIYTACIGMYNNNSRYNVYANSIPKFAYGCQLGMVYLDYAYTPLLNPENLQSDNVHPNTNGGIELAKNLLSLLLGGGPSYCSPVYSYTLSGDASSGVLNMQITGSVVRMWFSDIKYTVKTAGVINLEGITTQLFNNNFRFITLAISDDSGVFTGSLMPVPGGFKVWVNLNTGSTGSIWQHYFVFPVDMC